MTRAIVFDLDGTLIDSVPDVQGALNRLLASQGRRQLSLDEARSLVGEGARVLVAGAFRLTGGAAAANRLDELVESYIGFYKQHPADRTVVYPGVIEVLRGLDAEGIGLGICTNKPAVMTRLVLEALGLDRFFAGVAGGDDVAHRKPDGRHVAITLERMGATAASAVMVGDSETDVAAGRAAGLPVIAVTYGYAHGPADALGADLLIDDFAALPWALRRLWERREDVR